MIKPSDNLSITKIRRFFVRARFGKRIRCPFQNRTK